MHYSNGRRTRRAITRTPFAPNPLRTPQIPFHPRTPHCLCTLHSDHSSLYKIVTRDSHPSDHDTFPLRRLRNFLLRDALASFYTVGLNRLFGNVDVNLLTRERCFEDSYDC